MKNHDLFLNEVKKEFEKQLLSVNNFSSTKGLEYNFNHDLFDFSDESLYKDEEYVYLNELCHFIFREENSFSQHLNEDTTLIPKDVSGLCVIYSQNIKEVNFSYYDENSQDINIFFKLHYDKKSDSFFSSSVIENEIINDFLYFVSLHLLYKFSEIYKFIHIFEKEINFLNSYNLLQDYINDNEDAINILYLNFENPSILDKEQKKDSENIIKNVKKINEIKTKELNKTKALLSF